MVTLWVAVFVVSPLTVVVVVVVVVVMAFCADASPEPMAAMAVMIAAMVASRLFVLVMSLLFCVEPIENHSQVGVERCVLNNHAVRDAYSE